MSEFRFTDKLCPVCRKRFKSDDEIVVCPECGTPHHRTCWNRLNHCGVEEYHGMNYVWDGRLPDEEEPIKSGQSENEDPHHAEYPNIHPISLSEQDLSGMTDDPELGSVVKMVLSNEMGEDGVSMRELSAFSAVSVWHYSRAFSAFRGEKGKKHVVFFNFCSGLFSPIFQFYRKMDLFGVVTMLVMMLPSIIMIKLTGTTELQTSNGAAYLWYFANVVIDILLCLFNDYIYYRHAVKKIRKIREEYEGDTESDDYFMTLYQYGKPSLARAALGFLGMYFVTACLELILR